MDYVRTNRPVATIDSRIVHFMTRGLKEARSHSADPHTLAVMEVLREIIASMHYIGEGDVKPTDKDVLAYHIYARRVNLGDGEMVVRIVIREDKNGNMFYDDDATTVDMIKGSLGQELRNPIPVNDLDSLYAPHSLPEFFSEVKRGEANLEKFGSENGEPTVEAIARICETGDGEMQDGRNQ